MVSEVLEGRRLTLLFIVMTLAFFLDGLDGTIVTVALPEIGRSYGMTASASSWVVTAYFLTMAGLLLMFGKLSDKGAIKRILILGFLIFTAGSLMCGLAPSFAFLIVSRTVQGVGSAMLAATGIMLGVKFVPASKLTLAMAFTLLGSSIGSAAGPVLGGVIVEFASWHWMFFINVPIGIAAAALSKAVVPRDGGMSEGRFDLSGSALLLSAVVSGLYLLETVPADGFGRLSMVFLIVFIASFCAFVIRSLRAEDAVLDVRLFLSPRIDILTAVYLMVNASFIGCLYILPFYLSVGMGLSTLDSGLVMFIQAAATLAVCLKVGKVADVKGNRMFTVAGCLCLCLSSVVFMLVEPSMGVVPVAAGLVLFGLLLGFVGGPLAGRLILCAPPGKSGAASSLLSFLVYFGSALGSALFSALFAIGSESPGIEISLMSPAEFMPGFRFTMAVCLAMAVLSTVLCFAMNEEKKEKRS